MSEYYTIYEEYGERFYQVPKVFFTNDLYKKGLTDTEKLAFGMLKDRFELSKKNKWFDEKGRIYFIFTIENLMDIFDCSKTTAIKIKKSLIGLNLLEAKRRGRGLTDILYLKKPKVTDKDVYKIIEQEEKKPMEDKEKESETLGTIEKSKKWTSGSTENEPQEVQKMHPNDTDFKETENNKTENNTNPSSLEKEIKELNLPRRLMNELLANREKIEALNFNIDEFEKFYNQSPYVLELAPPDDIDHLSVWEVQDMLHNLFKNRIVIEKTTFGYFKKNTLTRLSMKVDNNLY